MISHPPVISRGLRNHTPCDFTHFCDFTPQPTKTHPTDESHARTPWRRFRAWRACTVAVSHSRAGVGGTVPTGTCGPGRRACIVLLLLSVVSRSGSPSRSTIGLTTVMLTCDDRSPFIRRSVHHNIRFIIQHHSAFFVHMRFVSHAPAPRRTATGPGLSGAGTRVPCAEPPRAGHDVARRFS